MKKSITENRNMTFDELIRLFIYRPYNDVLEYMVDSDERIHIKGDTWLVILDHNTGDFYFSGELHKYYSVDTIESIRDCFGDIYSIFNLKYDEVKRDIWMTIGDIPDIASEGYRKQYADEEKKRIMLQKKRDYYWAHREEIRKRRNIYKK
jgi:hypothetical protein